MTNKRPVHEGYFFEVTFVTRKNPQISSIFWHFYLKTVQWNVPFGRTLQWRTLFGLVEARMVLSMLVLSVRIG